MFSLVFLEISFSLLTQDDKFCTYKSNLFASFLACIVILRFFIKLLAFLLVQHVFLWNITVHTEGVDNIHRWPYAASVMFISTMMSRIMIFYVIIEYPTENILYWTLFQKNCGNSSSNLSIDAADYSLFMHTHENLEPLGFSSMIFHVRLLRRSCILMI